MAWVASRKSPYFADSRLVNAFSILFCPANGTCTITEFLNDGPSLTYFEEAHRQSSQNMYHVMLPLSCKTNFLLEINKVCMDPAPSHTNNVFQDTRTKAVMIR